MLNGNPEGRMGINYLTHADLIPIEQKTQDNTVNIAVLKSEFKNLNMKFLKFEKLIEDVDSKTTQLVAQQYVRHWVIRGAFIGGGWILGMIIRNYDEIVKFLNHMQW